MCKRLQESQTAHINGCALSADWFVVASASAAASVTVSVQGCVCACVCAALSLSRYRLAQTEPVPGPRVSRIKASKSPVEYNRYATRSDFIRENCFSHALRLWQRADVAGEVAVVVAITVVVYGRFKCD